MENKKTIALTGWSTWGHTFPLLSIFNYLKEKKKYNFVWIWEEESLEEEIAKKNNIKFYDLPAWKIRRYFDLRNLYEPLKNLTWIAFWVYYILKKKIDIVFSKWGYVSVPLCIAAKLLWKKIYVHESDTKTGFSNKIVWKLASKIFYSFPNKKIDNKKHIITGQILNPELIDYLDDVEVEENKQLTILVAAWSQWSRTIFKNLLKILPDLQDIKFHIILWEKNMWFRGDFKKFPNTIVHDFVTQKRLGKILKNIDLAISRWWATTLWELYYFWIHTIIIPLKNSAWWHQKSNAKFFKKNFWSDILDEDKNLNLELFRLLQKYKTFRKSWLNLDWFFDALKRIKKELKKDFKWSKEVVVDKEVITS